MNLNLRKKEDCMFDIFFGTDYHSHLGTRRGGIAVYGEKGFDRAIHNIENTPSQKTPTTIGKEKTKIFFFCHIGSPLIICFNCKKYCTTII